MGRCWRRRAITPLASPCPVPPVAFRETGSAACTEASMSLQGETLGRRALRLKKLIEALPSWIQPVSDGGWTARSPGVTAVVLIPATIAVHIIMELRHAH